MIRWRYLGVLAAMASVLVGVPALSQDFVVDQQSQMQTTGFWAVPSMGPLGQEFTPRTSVIAVAEFLLANEGPAWLAPGQAPPPSSDAHLVAYIHADSISGPVLGSSAMVILPAGASSAASLSPVPTRFSFEPPLPLIPGTRYVCELRSVWDYGATAVWGGDGNTYHGGEAVLEGGRCHCDLDFAFREGSDVATSVRKETWSRLHAIYRKDVAH